MRLTVLLKLAMRSVGRNTRRSALTSLAMVLGLALLVFSRSLAEGAYDKMIDSGVRMGSGAYCDPSTRVPRDWKTRAPS